MQKADQITYLVENLPAGASFNQNNRKFSWTPGSNQAGIYEITFIAQDNQGKESFELINIIVREEDYVNLAPYVSINSKPRDGGTVVNGRDIIIKASAKDSDGQISKVEFYDGDTKLGEDFVQPYEFSYKNAIIGDHQLKAKAYDNEGLIGDSSVINVKLEQVCQK